MGAIGLIRGVLGDASRYECNGTCAIIARKRIRRPRRSWGVGVGTFVKCIVRRWWQHLGTWLRRTAEVLRWMGQQERWLLWRPLDHPTRLRCSLAASAVHRGLDGAGQRAVESVPEQLAGIGETQEVGTDGLWTKLKGQVVWVVLLAVDSVSGLIYPPVVARDEDSASAWEKLFTRARAAGLDLQKLRGLCAAGAQGLRASLRRDLVWVLQQRCVWHTWRNLSGELARALSQAAQGLADTAAETMRVKIRGELVKLLRGVIDAQSAAAAEAALA